MLRYLTTFQAGGLYILCSVISSVAVIASLWDEFNHADRDMKQNGYVQRRHGYVGGFYFLDVLSANKYSAMVLLNGAVSVLLLIGYVIVTLIFGKLRRIEIQIVFCGAILEPEVHEIVVWASWFACIGFLRIFTILCKDRFDHIIFLPLTPLRTHAALFLLLTVIISVNVVGFIGCIYQFRTAGVSVLLLLTFECVTLFLDNLQTLIKYFIHLDDLYRENSWESRSTVIYVVEFITDSLVLMVTLAHYVHILSLHGLSFTLIDTVIFLNMRSVFNRLRSTVSSFRSFRRVTNSMESRFVSATDDELRAYNDDCAICRENLDTAKRLPCGHMFHMSCLRSWIIHHNSCPTCRRILFSNPSLESTSDLVDEIVVENALGDDRQDDTAHEMLHPQPQRAVFHGEWSLSRWLFPNMSFRITTNTINFQHGVMSGDDGTTSTRITSIASPTPDVTQLREMFPQIPSDILQEDLVNSGSLSATIDNVLEGRLLWQPGDYHNDDINDDVHNDNDLTQPINRTDHDGDANVIDSTHVSPSADDVVKETMPVRSNRDDDVEERRALMLAAALRRRNVS